ncbi:hypothetical protein [Spirosoma flavus]
MKTSQPVNRPTADPSSTTYLDGQFELRYRQYVGKVLRTWLSIKTDELIVPDYTQDMFISAFEKHSPCQNRSSFFLVAN